MDQDNDRTIGRTNVSGGVSHLLASAVDEYEDDEDEYDNDDDGITSSLAAVAIASSSTTTTATAATAETVREQQQKSLHHHPPPPPPLLSRARTSASIYSPGGSFQWPTSAEYYQLSNRIGQGAFATVWGGRIKRKASAVNLRKVGGGVGGVEENSSFEGGNDGDNANNNDEQQQQVVVDCAIKIMDLEHVNININDLRLEVQTMRLSSHPNILVCHASFVRDTDLWLVTQLMSKGSSLHCLQGARAKLLMEASSLPSTTTTTTTTATTAMNGQHQHNNNDTIIPPPPSSFFTYTSDDAVLEGGLSSHASIIDPELLVFETHITYILYETLLGLKYIHDNGQIHRDIKAGNILLDGRAYVRIADFGVSSWLIDGGNRREHTTTFVGTPCWMAPEVMEQVEGYDYKADIWSLGITALELCKGYAPYAKFAPMKVLLLTIQEDPPSLHTYNDADDISALWSQSFRSMITWCLQKDPSKRPTCQELLAHPHFQPLANADERAQWRGRTKKEVCDMVEDVEKSGSGNSVVTAAAAPVAVGVGGDQTEEDSSSRNLAGGATPIIIATNTKRDRPAGTSWIFPMDSPVASGVVTEDASSQYIPSSLEGTRTKDQDFFDQFEEQTGGENFNRDNLLAETVAQDDNTDEDNADLDNKIDDGPSKEEEDEEDDMNDFFDQFEEQTGGENFRKASF
jgi:serine/threonine-protein kinase OSR1/STK39